jgi:hypothetical protein
MSDGWRAAFTRAFDYLALQFLLFNSTFLGSQEQKHDKHFGARGFDAPDSAEQISSYSRVRPI